MASSVLFTLMGEPGMAENNWLHPSVLASFKTFVFYNEERVRDRAQLIECLLDMFEALGPIPTHRIIWACALCSESEASLGTGGPARKTNKNNEKIHKKQDSR